MRGEKIPVMILDNDKVQAAARSGNITGSMLNSMLYEMASGWYVIDGVMWCYGMNDSEGRVSKWSTKLKLVRREWPIPGRMALQTVTDNDQVNNVELNAGNTSNSGTSTLSDTLRDLATAGNYSSDGGNFTDASDLTSVNDGMNGTDATTALDVDISDKTGTAEEVPLSGLRDELKEVYHILKNDCPKIKIVSARRWAVDESGKRVDGNAFVEKNGLYKCANAKGEIMYFKDKHSKHLYGEAFDIVNDSGQDFNSIMTDYVLQDNNLLTSMAKNGISACIEQTTDDSGAATKHYHFGTDEGIMNAFWTSVLAINTHLTADLAQSIKNISAARIGYEKNEITRTDVNEDDLNA